MNTHQEHETYAYQALRALGAHSEANAYNDLNSRVIDLLTDLMHLCDQRGIDFERALLCAEDNFEEERQ